MVQIACGCDADLLLLDEKSLELRYVIARGVVLRCVPSHAIHAQQAPVSTRVHSVYPANTFSEQTVTGCTMCCL